VAGGGRRFRSREEHGLGRGASSGEPASTETLQDIEKPGGAGLHLEPAEDVQGTVAPAEEVRQPDRGGV
jgi:hypothetical protein